MGSRLAFALFLGLSFTAARADDAGVGDPALGKDVYGALCVDCHFEKATGDDRAPDIRGATIPEIRRGTSGMDVMDDFGFSDETIQDLFAYLASLVD